MTSSAETILQKCNEMLAYREKATPGLIQLARHDDDKLPGFETMTLLVSGKVDKYSYYKKGVIIAQCFAPTIGQAENNAEFLNSAANNSAKLAKALKIVVTGLEHIESPKSHDGYPISETAQDALQYKAIASSVLAEAALILKEGTL